jgi:hypothetical protein
MAQRSPGCSGYQPPTNCWTSAGTSKYSSISCSSRLALRACAPAGRPVDQRLIGERLPFARRVEAHADQVTQVSCSSIPGTVHPRATVNRYLRHAW